MAEFYVPPLGSPNRPEWVRTHISKLRARTVLPLPERWCTETRLWVSVEPLDIFAMTEALEATNTGTLHEFTLFPELPIELRKTIFEMTIPDARTIEFSCYNADIASNPNSDDQAPPSYDFLTPLPGGHTDLATRHIAAPSSTPMKLPWVLLAVNSESREVAQHFYTLSFEKQLGRGIYIDFKRDSLLFTSAYALQTMGGMLKPWKHSNWARPKVEALVERLPANRNEAEKYAQNIMIAGLLPKSKPLCVILSRFQNLKTVHLVNERVQPTCVCGQHTDKVCTKLFISLWKELRDLDAEKTGTLPSAQAFPEVVKWKETEFFREFTSKWIRERQGYRHNWSDTLNGISPHFQSLLESMAHVSEILEGDSGLQV